MVPSGFDLPTPAHAESPVRAGYNQGMDETTRKRSGCGPGVVVTLVALLVMSPVLYVLSYGPICMLVWDWGIGRPLVPTVKAVYAPLQWASNSWPPFGEAVHSYREWWAPEQPDE